MRLIHITDPHLSSLEEMSFFGLRGKRRSGYLSWYRKRRHIYRRETLQQLTESVAGHQADQLLVTGDLVHIGLEQEMREAADWLKQLGPAENVFLIPGNHDNYAGDSLASMYRHWGPYLPAGGVDNDSYSSVFPVTREWPGLQLVGVNTACVTRIFSATGELGENQRARLEAALECEPGDNRLRCLLIHHPPFPGMTRKRKALRDAAELREIASRQPADLILYGHLHYNREHLVENTRIYCTASASDHSNASYRIFDLERNDSGWSCHMRLMQLAGHGRKHEFRVSAESRWQV